MSADTPTVPAAARILVVDDEPYNRELMKVVLELDGHVVLTAADGATAIAAAIGDRPDLILLDVATALKDAFIETANDVAGILQDIGYQVASVLKTDARTKHIPIIIVTALGDRNSMMHGLTAGAEEFVTKPVDRAELCTRVRNLLRLAENAKLRS